jgi:hypothetical protein
MHTKETKIKIISEIEINNIVNNQNNTNKINTI